MNKEDFFDLLKIYDLTLKAISNDDNIGILKLYYADIEICEVLRTDFSKIKNCVFDEESLGQIIFNLSSISEQELNLQAFTYKVVFKNFLAFQKELKDYNKRQEFVLDRMLKFDSPILTNNEEKQNEIVVSGFSNVTLFLVLGIIVLMAIVFELRLQNRNDDMQKSVFELQKTIISLEDALSQITNKVSNRKNISQQKEQNKENQQNVASQEPLFKIPQIGNKKELTEFMEERATNLGIDPKIVKTIINIESKNNPFAIGIVSNDPKAIVEALRDNENILVGYKTNSKFVSIIPKNENIANDLYDVLQKNKDDWGIVSIDYGLMQVNHETILAYELEPKDIYLNSYYNIALGIDVLKSCYNLFPKNQFNTIECYNKGVDKRKLDNSNDYYNKFIEEFKRTI